MYIRSSSLRRIAVGAITALAISAASATAASAESPDPVNDSGVTATRAPAASLGALNLSDVTDEVTWTNVTKVTIPSGFSNGTLAASAACASSTTYWSATGTHKIAGVTAWVNYLDAKIVHSCNGITSLSITGAVEQSKLLGISEKSVTDKTAVFSGRYGRTKAKYNYTLAGSTTSSCLGMNFIRSEVALVVDSDTSCSANPPS